MSDNEPDGATIAFGLFLGAVSLVCVGGLAGFTALGLLILLLLWLGKEYPDVLIWFIGLTAVFATGFGLWQLGTWLWEAHRLAMLEGGSVVCFFIITYFFLTMINNHYEQKKKAKRHAEEDAEKKHRMWLGGGDFQHAIYAKERLFIKRIEQLRAAKKNAERLQQDINMHRASGDPDHMLHLCEIDAEREQTLIRALTLEAAKTWAQMLLQGKIIRFTVFLRNVPDLSVLKKASLINDPEQARKVYASLWQKLSQLCDQMFIELQDQSILMLRPPHAAELYPLIESHLQLAVKHMNAQFEEHLRELAKQVARLHYLEGAAERAKLHREANIDMDRDNSPSDVAEAMQEAVERFAKTVDEAKRHLTDAEVESVTQIITPRAIMTDDFIDSLELEQLRARTASKLRQPR